MSEERPKSDSQLGSQPPSLPITGPSSGAADPHPNPFSMPEPPIAPPPSSANSNPLPEPLAEPSPPWTETAPGNWRTHWKAHLRQWSQRSIELLKEKRTQIQSLKKLDKKTIQVALQNFDPQKALDWVTKTLQKRGAHFFGILLTIVLSTYFLADLSSLIVGQLIPEPATNRVGRSSMPSNRTKQLELYTPIFSRNLFNSQGLIPGDATAAPASGSADPGGVPVKSSLPLNLIGTLILNNEALSIATIEDKSSSSVFPMRADDEIPGKIKVVKVEPRRVIFVNKSSNRREYLELPEEPSFQNPILTPGKATASTGIEKVAPTQYNIPRSEVDKSLADFNNILTQARAVPNFENGIAAGYKLFQIVPGSIYDKLGLQNGDVVTGLNGSPINDPGKAFEMLSELKTSNHLELQVKKDGKQLTYTYDIH